MTSATLSVNNSFTYLLEQLGIPEDSVDVLQIQSPFLYDEQVSLLVDTSLPEPSGVNEDIYTSAVQEALLTLIKATRGGTLVLFTSRKQLKQVYEGLSQSVQEMGFELFADGINGNRINLVNELKDNPKAIVFGTNTFWEGIDPVSYTHLDVYKRQTVEEAETTTEASEVHWDIKSLEEAFMPGSSIAKGLGVYQKRTQQIKMMKAVAKAFQQERHLIVEAGTGVGKTLAYLVPALNWSLSQSEKVVVSTHTIALQEQILSLIHI